MGVVTRTPADEAVHIQQAIDAGREGMLAHRGGPFGAVVVGPGGTVAGVGCNRVTSTNDPTAHAEVVAIRAACASLGTFLLEGCTLYTSCEPCPMCLGAAWWARVAEIVYANDRADAAAIGFDDDAIYDEVVAPLDRRKLPIRRLGASEALEVFKLWHSKPDKVPY